MSRLLNNSSLHTFFNGNPCLFCLSVIFSGSIDSDDETINATLKVGKEVNGKFETKYRYSFTVKEGQHDYIFRISSDYYWYINETNAVKLVCDEQLVNVNMEILEGD